MNRKEEIGLRYIDYSDCKTEEEKRKKYSRAYDEADRRSREEEMNEYEAEAKALGYRDKKR